MEAGNPFTPPTPVIPVISEYHPDYDDLVAEVKERQLDSLIKWGQVPDQLLGRIWMNYIS